MQLRVTGKNIDVGDALRDQVEARLEQALGKYFDRGASVNVTVERERAGFKTAEDEDVEELSELQDNPIIIAESQTSIRSMTVGMAVMSLDLSESPLCVFHNVANGRMNVVYRRSDGNVGWIDPPHSNGKEARD